jgi:hypothetical protein
MTSTVSPFPREQFVFFEQTGGLRFEFRVVNYDGVPLGMLCHSWLSEVNANLDGLPPSAHRVEVIVYTSDARPFSLMQHARVSMRMDRLERYVIDLTEIDDKGHFLGCFFRPSASSFDWAFQPGCIRRDECLRHLPLDKPYIQPQLVTRELPNPAKRTPLRLVSPFELPAHAIVN